MAVKWRHCKFLVVLISLCRGQINETDPLSGEPFMVDPDSKIFKITENPYLREIDEKYSLCRGVDIREIGIGAVQKLYQSGQLTVLELTQCYIQRLDRMNPMLRVITQLNPDVVAEAVKLDQEIQSGTLRSSLHGIPVLLKDGIGTADGMETTAGSAALIGLRPKKDADVVEALRKAGALILGKANLSEFYYFRGTNIPNGWSTRGGQTRNAYNLNVTPEGSSSGSAVAVSANLCMVSIGTETDGSMLGPASVAGVCVMKPTFGLVSVNGVIPVSRNQDHVGPMTRTVTDLAIVLDALVPVEKRPKNHPSSYTATLPANNEATNQRPLRIGVLRYPFWDTSVINSTQLHSQMPFLETVVKVMSNSPSFQVLDPVEMPQNELYGELSKRKEFIMLVNDFKHDLNEYLANDIMYPSGSPPATLRDVIGFIEEHPIPEGYNQLQFLRAEAAPGASPLDPIYVDARDSNKIGARQFLDSVLDKYSLDAVVVPSEPRMDSIIEESLREFPTYGPSMACIAGYPSIHIPIGIRQGDGVPFGITFIGKPYTEPSLLKIAYLTEKLTLQRFSPKFLI